MIPSRRLYLLLFLGMAIAIAAAVILDPQTSAIITLIFDAVLLILGIIDAQWVKRQKVQVSRQPLHKLSIGRDNPVVLTVDGSSRSCRILIHDSYPQEFTVSTSTFDLILPANNTQELIYTIRPDRRGEFQWENIYVRQLGKWGLGWYSWQIPNPQTVSVYPDLIGLRTLSIRLAIQNTGTLRQVRRFGQGTEFAELREYGVGDDTRLIDWKATARRSRPVVRVLEPEKEQTLIILLDRGRLMTAKVQGMQRFDWGLNAALSLAVAGLHRGDRVGIGVFDKEITTWIPPEGGQQQLSRLIERLTPIQPNFLEPDYFGTITRIVNQQTRRALVVILTDIVDSTASSELLAALTRLTPRYLPFCITLRDPQCDRIAHNEEEDTQPSSMQQEITKAYSRAVALDLLAQRETAFAKLKQQGVLVLDAPADRISDAIVERYLQLKARNLL
ncbi:MULTISPECIES: DUF58 domain-containing protein [Spirulina sp. CCY15215]|uniref:DUF58 domain-containing protein n=1 Tax=Spirulina sp. CCY15215 TaxID=2767591 RepID=UPI00194F6D32|nr:DUF58 domain-containing protein [Spirulina major]